MGFLGTVATCCTYGVTLTALSCAYVGLRGCHQLANPTSRYLRRHAFESDLRAAMATRAGTMPGRNTSTPSLPGGADRGAWMVRVCYCDRASDGEPHDSEASMSQKRTNQPNSKPMSAGEDPPTDALAVPAGNMLG